MIRIFDDLDTLSRAAADYIASYAQQRVDKAGRFTWLLSGGSTPARAFQLLASPPYAAQPFWPKTHIYWGDERCVPPDSDQSNYHLARRDLLDKIPVPPSQIHRMPAERPDRDAAAADYATLLPEHPDLILLGMGPDGHTASLFPGSPALTETTRRVVAVEAPDYVQPRHRLTITPPAIQAGARLLVLAAGADKAEPLERVFLPKGDIHQTPARLARDATWLVDRPAAQRISKLNLGEIQRAQSAQGDNRS
jgi:6-phosphogluconolactonase